MLLYNMDNLQHLNSVIKVSPLQLTDKARKIQVDRVLLNLHLNANQLARIQEVFHLEMERGIRSDSSSLQMENTYIPELVDGTEEGQFLALDLGGTNFRVLHLELSCGRVVSEHVQHYQIAKELRIGCGVALFDFLAKCIAEFVRTQGLSGVRLPLGFTFSFPMVQKGLDVGELVTWTKTFNCSSVVGLDVVRLLREALERRGDTHVDVLAILNDTTGTLVQGAMMDHRAAIGLILGTGTNACYMERASRVQHWEGERHGEKQVIIDIEWGAFGDNGVLDFIKTDFDRKVDDGSIIAQSFTFEKYISGKYLGELVRLILVKLAMDGLLFEKTSIDDLCVHGAFSTTYVSRIEQDSVEGGTDNTTEILDKLRLTYTIDDITIVKHVCELVSNRAALLVSICLATLILRMDRPDTTVAVDGSLYKYHPRLKHLIDTYITLFAPNKKFQLLLAEDGSGKGAALVAAIALKLQKRFQFT